MGIATAVLVAGAGAIAVAAAPTSGTLELAPKSIGTATAVCKPGRVAVSGGFKATNFAKNDSGMARIGMRKGRARVTTRAYNFGEASGELVSYAYCQKRPAAPVRRVARTTVAPERAKSLVAVCPRGTRVISGGFATGGFTQASGAQVLTLTSKRVGNRRWKVAGFNLPADGDEPGVQRRSGKLAAYAYCVKRNAPLTSVWRRVYVPASPPSGPDKPRTVRVNCPGSGRAVSGGFDGNLKLGGEPWAAGAITSMRTRDGRGWRTSAVSLAENIPSRITAYVYCN